MRWLAALLLGVAVLVHPGRESNRRTRRLLRRPRPAPTPAVDIADVADLLALALGTGAGVAESMTAVADVVGGRLGRDLSMVVAAERWGLDHDAAWGLLDPAWRPVARALTLAEAAGVPPASTLATAADDIRRAESHRLTAAVERLSIHLVLPLGLTYLPAFVATAVVPLVGALAGDLLLP